MAKIDDLNVSISRMVYEEAFALVKRLRESRRIQKKAVKTRKASVSRVAKRPKDLLTMLTPEEKAILLATLGGGESD